MGFDAAGGADGVVADWVVLDGTAAGGAGVERSLGAGAGVGNGMVSAPTAAPASHPDSNTAIHTAWRMPAMSFSAFVSATRRPLRRVRYAMSAMRCPLRGHPVRPSGW